MRLLAHLKWSLLGAAATGLVGEAALIVQMLFGEGLGSIGVGGLLVIAVVWSFSAILIGMVFLAPPVFLARVGSAWGRGFRLPLEVAAMAGLGVAVAAAQGSKFGYGSYDLLFWCFFLLSFPTAALMARGIETLTVKRLCAS